jgi:hypothetical protein
MLRERDDCSHERALELRGRRGSRCVYPYSQWMLQRALHEYQSVEPAKRQTIDPWLLELGGLDPMQMRIEHPVMRFKYKLVPALDVTV